MHLEPDIFFGTNICTIHLYYMDWRNDSLCIYFVYKNHQFVNRKRDPTHIYSNPLDPIVCPILSLSLSLSLSISIFNIICTIDSTLFPGKIHYKSFSKYLQKICLKYGEKIMREFRVNIKNIGVHSLWKGTTSCISLGDTFHQHKLLPTSELDGWWVSFMTIICVVWQSSIRTVIGRVVLELLRSSS